MKTAGVVFDFYDDPDGRLLKEAFPTADELPPFIKTAHILNTEERGALRNEGYALVMKNGEDILRKYACVDKGNTFLSALYFAESMDFLPDEARQVAAEHLAAACERYDLDIPFIKEAAEMKSNELDREPERVERPPKSGDEKRKRASGMGRVRDSMQQPLVGDEADWAMRTNLVSVRGGNDSGRVVPTANSMKTASANFVDVTGKDPDARFEKHAAETVVLDRYPLDSYADVREAVKYFEENWTGMEPEDRREFCKLASPRAQEIGLDVPEMMVRYGSPGYAPDVEAHLANRKVNCDESCHEMYDALKEKRAEIEPEDFAELLMRADVAAGLNWHWGGAICDPWYATFGGDSDKEKVAYSWEGRGEAVDEEALTNLASNKELLLGTFEKDIVYAFQKDPITIFESMPDDQKVILARLATGG